jgi:hypothetical protein
MKLSLWATTTRHPQAMSAGEFVSSEHDPMSWNSVTQNSVMQRILNIIYFNFEGALKTLA